MDTIVSEVLDLSGELVGQEKEEKDFGVTEFGEKLTNSNDMEFLWVVRSASGSAKNATTSIKNYSEERISDDVSKNGSIRLGNEVFVYSKSSTWKTNDPAILIKWLVTNAKDNETLIEDLLSVLGRSFVPKLMGLDAVAKKRDKDPQVIRDTFLYKEWKEKPDLKSINTEAKSSPKWAQDLTHGERKK